MNARKITRFFPNSEICVVHQNGQKLTDSAKGVEVIIHFRENEEVPCCAEVFSADDEDHYAAIGLTFEGKMLSDYDGAFNLPPEVGEMLTKAGYIVTDDLC
jgi:hypothetical protein